MSTIDDFSTAITSLAEAVGAACADPRDAIRILAELAAYEPAEGAGAAGRATAARCRQAALTALCRACETVVLTSYNDAVTLLSQVVALLDAEIEYCGDNPGDRSFIAFDALKAAVVANLLARGASLAPLRTFEFKASLPAPVIAQRLYRDSTREGEVIARDDQPHPAFSSLTITLLAK